MFETLTDKFNDVFRKLSGRGRIGEQNVHDAMRDVRTALLEADVNYQVVRKFCDDVVRKAIGQEVTAHSRAPVVNPDGAWVDLSVLKALVRRCDLVLTTDSGLRHVAMALGVPTVVLMGPTDPRHTASNLENTIILREDVDCAPCHLKVCPTDHRCMERIEVKQVIAAAERILTDDGRSR